MWLATQGLGGGLRKRFWQEEAGNCPPLASQGPVSGNFGSCVPTHITQGMLGKGHWWHCWAGGRAGFVLSRLF